MPQLPRIEIKNHALRLFQNKYLLSGLACENKVELKSYEIYDPIRGQWTLIEDEGGLRKKRWAAASVAFRDENLLVIGGMDINV